MTLSGRIPRTPDDDDEEWMVTFGTLPDDEIDALLRGELGSPIAGGITDLVQVVRADVVRRGAPAMTAELRAQIARPAPSRVARRRRLLAGSLGGLMLGGATMGVAAAQDVLPAAVQDATATVGEVFGVDLPRAAERDAPAGGDIEDESDDGSGVTEPGATDPAEGPADSTPAEVPPSTPRPRDSTPGGAVPADPGIPGDEEPAIPATPATGNGRGTGQGNGANGQGSANGNRTGNSSSDTGEENGPGAVRP